MKKCYDHPVYDTGIRTHDLSEHESPPVTTRPGLPPINSFVKEHFYYTKNIFCLNHINSNQLTIVTNSNE